MSPYQKVSSLRDLPNWRLALRLCRPWHVNLPPWRHFGNSRSDVAESVELTVKPRSAPGLRRVLLHSRIVRQQWRRSWPSSLLLLEVTDLSALTRVLSAGSFRTALSICLSWLYQPTPRQLLTLPSKVPTAAEDSLCLTYLTARNVYGRFPPRPLCSIARWGGGCLAGAPAHSDAPSHPAVLAQSVSCPHAVQYIVPGSPD